MKLWLNGHLRDSDEPAIAADDRGLLMGDGLYETLLVRNGRPARLAAHLERLRRGAAVIGLPLPDIEFAAAMQQVLAANRLLEGSLRLTVTRGAAPRGIAPPAVPSPTAMIAVAAAAPPPPPARCIVATRTRRNEHSPLAGIKHLNCLDSILARIEAGERDADDAILLNSAGQVAEATAANVFVVLAGRLLTPPVADGALPGIRRAEIVARGAVEVSLTADDLRRAEAIFLTNSLGVRPLCRIDGRTLAADVGLLWRDALEFPEDRA